MIAFCSRAAVAHTYGDNRNISVDPVVLLKLMDRAQRPFTCSRSPEFDARFDPRVRAVLYGFGPGPVSATDWVGRRRRQTARASAPIPANAA